MVQLSDQQGDVEAQKRSAAATPPAVGVVVLDRDLRVVIATCRHLTGGAPEQARGRLISEILPEESRGLVRRFRAAADGRPSGLDHGLRDGRTLGITVSVYRERGELAGAIITTQDVTTERRGDEQLSEERKLFTGAFSAASIGVAMTSLDGVILRPNARLFQLTGHPEATLVGMTVGDLVAPTGQPIQNEHLARLAANEIDEYVHDGEYLRADGTTFPGALRIARVADERGRALFFMIHLTDLTDSRATESALAAVTRQFSSAFENAPLGMALTSPEGKPLKVNPALCRMTGYTARELLGMQVQDLIHPADLAAVREEVDATLAGVGMPSLQGEMRWFDSDGHILWVSVYLSQVLGATGEVDHFVVQVMDVSSRRRMQERLAYMADHDVLTDLLNRRRFEEELDQQIARDGRYGEGGAVLLIDIDNFKHVNDTLGHSVGDDLLKAIARLLVDRLRTTDVVSRLGGDEFAVMLPYVNSTQAHAVAAELTAAIRVETRAVAGASLDCSASIGIAMLDDAVTTTEDVLIAADLAMYDAKRSRGSGSSPLPSLDRPEVPSFGLRWAQEMMPAITAERFALEAQPIIDAATGEATHHELLVRLIGPDGRMIDPGTFLPHAERFGLIVSIDRWVIGQAVSLLAEHDKIPALAVNVSARSLGDPTLVEYVDQLLRDAGISGGRLAFEISESEAIANLPMAAGLARSLAALGCSISIDDFGSGFAGFSYIKHLPFDYIKIDGGFIRELIDNPTDRLVVEALVHVAAGLGKKTIAEWVADERTQEEVTRLGVDLIQGFHAGRPTPVELAFAD